MQFEWGCIICTLKIYELNICTSKGKQFLKSTAKIWERKRNKANVVEMLTLGNSLHCSCSFLVNLKLCQDNILKEENYIATQSAIPLNEHGPWNERRWDGMWEPQLAVVNTSLQAWASCHAECESRVLIHIIFVSIFLNLHMHFYYIVYITHLGIQIVKQDYKTLYTTFQGWFKVFKGDFGCVWFLLYVTTLDLVPKQDVTTLNSQLQVKKEVTWMNELTFLSGWLLYTHKSKRMKTLSDSAFRSLFCALCPLFRICHH